MEIMDLKYGNKNVKNKTKSCKISLVAKLCTMVSNLIAGKLKN